MRTDAQKSYDLKCIRDATADCADDGNGFTTLDINVLRRVRAELAAYKAAVASVLDVPPYSSTDPGTDDFKAGFNHRTQCDRNIINRKLNGRK